VDYYWHLLSDMFGATLSPSLPYGSRKQAPWRRENKRRDVETRDVTYDDVHIERKNSDGKTEKMKIDKVHLNYSYTMSMTLKLRDQAFLDLTDIQNRDFRYVL